MAKRKLLIVKRYPPPTLGVCERCNAQFKSSGIQEQFDVHKCQPTDSSQNALRIVREATEGK
jgi:tRNA(Ile2) C34 agmatinyltransferase TiaS